MNKKAVVAILAVFTIMSVLGGCSQADKVNRNLADEADSFNVVRQLTVFNGITNDIQFQMTGKLSIEVDSEDDQLEVVVEDENGDYFKKIIGFGDNTVYLCEDLNATDVENYKYTIKFNPNMWIPVGIEEID